MELLITNDDGSTTKFTEEMATVAIKERDQLRTELTRVSESRDKYTSKVADIRKLVHDFFNNEYNAGESEITVQVEDVNQLLKDIGANLLKSLFTVKGTISFEIVDIEAESEDDAQNSVENYLELKWDEDGDLSDWSVEVSQVTEQ